MRNKESKFPPSSYIGIGLVFGSGIGISFGPAFGNVGLGLVFGSCIGLIIGSVAFSLSKNNNQDDES